jgi:hypothetical protein
MISKICECSGLGSECKKELDGGVKLRISKQRGENHMVGSSIIDRNGKAVKVSGPMTEFDMFNNEGN